jgi:hypothetical protein
MTSSFEVTLEEALVEVNYSTEEKKWFKFSYVGIGIYLSLLFTFKSLFEP